MHVFNYSPTSYLGIEKVGQMDFSSFIIAIKNVCKSFLLVFFEWNIFENGVTAFSLLNILFIMFSLCFIFVLIVKRELYKKKEGSFY